MLPMAKMANCKDGKCFFHPHTHKKIFYTTFKATIIPTDAYKYCLFVIK